VTPVSPMRTDRPIRPYDVAKANQLLDEAGWVRGTDGIRAKNGAKLNLVFSINTGAADTDQMIEIIRQSWAQVGVSLEVHHYVQALFFAPAQNNGTIYSGKFDVTSFAWGMTPDADYTPQNNCDGIPPKGQNVTRLCDPVIQGLLEQEKAAYDEGPRKAIIAKLDDRLDEVVPYFILYVRDDIHGVNKDLQNWHPNSITPFDDFLNVDI